MPKKTSPKNKKQKKSTKNQQVSNPNQETVVKASSTSTPNTATMSDVTVKSQNTSKPTTQPTAGQAKTKEGSALSRFLADETNRARVYAVLFGSLFIVITLAVTFVWIPQVVKNTDDYKAIEERERLAQEERDNAEQAERDAQARAALIEEENASLVFEDRTVTMTTSYGDLVIDLSYDTAPVTVDNFIRLANRGFFEDQKIHRMVLADGFNVIQGGQANEGQNSEAALGGTVVDELWEVRPEFSSSGQEAEIETAPILLNEPQLRQPALARDFDAAQGTIVYPKGLILMAKTSQPNSATTQFFVTLTDTTLPAEYTAFGTVRQDNFGTLDRIRTEVTPEEGPNTSEIYQDGAPNPEITYSIKLNEID